MDNIEIDLNNNIDTPATNILSFYEGGFLNQLINGGVNHTNILNIFSQICHELEFNKQVRKELSLTIGSEKALVAIEITKKMLIKLKEVKTDLNDKEIAVIDFFISEEGIMILMASTTLIVKTFKHISESYKQADLDGDGLVYGKKECTTFLKRMFCCHKSPTQK